MPTTKKKSPPKFEPFEYVLAFGDQTAAPEGLVLLRISRSGNVLVEEHMPPSEFLQLARGFENVARGIRNALETGSAG